MRFLIFLLDTFIITVIANGITEWKHRYHRSKGYYQMLYTCGIWMAFVNILQYLHALHPTYVKYVIGLPIGISIVFGYPYLKYKYKMIKKNRPRNL